MYLVMQLCTGGSLYAALLSRRFTEVEVVRYTRELFAALAACHARGIAHRDIKLQNVMLQSAEPEAPLVLVDFGLGRHTLNTRHGFTQCVAYRPANSQ